MVMASPSALFSAPGSLCGGGDGECEEGGGGGNDARSVTVGGVTTVSTAIETPVTLASMAVALLALLVALAIVDCTEAAIAVVVWMLTPTTTLPDDRVNSTADGPTLALAAIALFISVRTLGSNEETSPASSRVNLTTLIAGREGGGGKGEGGGGEGGGGDGEGGGGEGSDGRSEGGGRA
jgi:hypothetical protein